MTNRILKVLPVLVCLTATAAAQDWRHISSTRLYKVMLDRDSLRQTVDNRTAVALKFEPLGRKELKSASMSFGLRGYAYHIEYYEISCSGDAVHRLLDLFSADGRRIGRQNLPGDTEQITAGTSLGYAADFICPESGHDDDDATDDEEDVTGGTKENDGDGLGGRHSADSGKSAEEAAAQAAASPMDAGAWIRLGNIHYDSGNAVKAIEAYEKALAIAPDNVDVLNDQGAMYRQAGKFPEAVASFEKVLKLDPYNLESLYNLGYVCAYDLNRPEKAREAWSRYLDLDKTSENSRTIRTMMDRLPKTTTPVPAAEKTLP